METPPWYVLTGGPCTGKSTLIQELANRGYATVPEAARTYIDAGYAEGKTLLEIRADEGAFQRALIPLKVAAEKEASSNITFFDRGMHDSIVYYDVAGIAIDSLLADALQSSRYRKVFLLDRLPYEQDEARTEDEVLATRIHNALGKAYEDADMEVVVVPVLSIRERANFILAHL